MFVFCLDNQVNQANQSNPLGSGLGYLEHICQLIEKIGQLQEHNLRLQKQICTLQKEGRVIKTKERVISKLALSVQALGPEKTSTVTVSELSGGLHFKVIKESKRKRGKRKEETLKRHAGPPFLNSQGLQFFGLCVSLEKKQQAATCCCTHQKAGELLKRAPVSTIMDQAVSPVSSLAVLPTVPKPSQHAFHFHTWISSAISHDRSDEPTCSIRVHQDFFMQHCSCGAASLAFQELKRHFRSDHYSLMASSGTLSDLSTIPEVTRIPLRAAMRDGEMGCQPALPVWRRGLNRRSYTEGEAKYLSDSAEVLSAPHRRSGLFAGQKWLILRYGWSDHLSIKLQRLSENYTWGRVKELVKKTKLRNQSRLGLSSGSLKRSCPQLYRPDVMSAEWPRTNRNSMIALGHQKLDYLWSRNAPGYRVKSTLRNSFSGCSVLPKFTSRQDGI
ncbi:Sorting nexin-4 [Labeo rohita]|uniref:Sorting nexin-4 n=1 Tax=Labeo rohita TaxID=84645 RepID=A0ABQ8M4Z7_LABRO|nr:Sorting nexin-4 [Labeo rohita]